MSTKEVYELPDGKTLAVAVNIRNDEFFLYYHELGSRIPFRYKVNEKGK